MREKLVAWSLAVGRIAIGVSAYVAPERLGRGWFGPVAEQPGTRIATRALAARDVALGLGSVAALASGRDTDRWVEAGILADTGDAVATVLAGRSLPAWKLVGVTAMAGGAALTGVWLRWR